MSGPVSGEDWLRTIGLLLVLEGAMPFLTPGNWRETFLRIARLRDGQIRFIGFAAVLAGLALLLV